MQVHSFIQSSHTSRYQQAAVTRFENPEHNFITRRITGVIQVPLASLVDALRAVWTGLVELKNCVTDYTNCANHLKEAVHAFVFAELFAFNIFLSPTVNCVDPNLLNGILNPQLPVEPLITPEALKDLYAELAAAKASVAELTESGEQRANALTQAQDELNAAKQNAEELSAKLTATQKQLEAAKNAHEHTLKELEHKSGEPNALQSTKPSSDVTSLFGDTSDDQTSRVLSDSPVSHQTKPQGRGRGNSKASQRLNFKY